MATTRLVDRRSLAEAAEETRAGYASREQVEEYVAHLRVSFLQCRELGHIWKPYDAQFDEEHNSFTRVLRCPRCTSKRHESLSLRGAKLKNHYEYADGFLTEGLGRIVGEGRDALRVESITRTLTTIQNKEAKAS